jgi:hypothetical protein
MRDSLDSLLGRAKLTNIIHNVACWYITRLPNRHGENMRLEIRNWKFQSGFVPPSDLALEF